MTDERPCPACSAIRKYVPCPQYTADPGKHTPHCPICRGARAIWHCPTCHEQKQKLLDLARPALPGLDAFVRDLYARGLIPGLRALRSVTIAGERHGEPALPASLVVTNPPPMFVPRGAPKATENDEEE